MEYLLYFIFIMPLICAIVCISGLITAPQINTLSRFAGLINMMSLLMLFRQNQLQPIFKTSWLYVDALSVWFVMVLSIMYLLVTFISYNYLIREAHQYTNNNNYIAKYYSLLHVFMSIMFIVLCIDNLGLMWVCIEATTLVSALLVAFKFTRLALEAAWKYVMVCTVGICLALLGTIILYYAQLNALGVEQALDWWQLKEHAKELDPNIVKFAFFFIFIGYATKLGLAPMHTWLPDAYSQAPSPISGLLSGGLSTCVLYVLIKNIMIVKLCLGSELVSNLLLAFGLLSVALALPFLLVQRELKRLLAYSSVENMGILAIALSLNSQIAAIGLLLHVFNHAIIKFNLFYLAGRIIHDFSTTNMMRIHGMLVVSPVLARCLLLATIAISGLPPFGMFFSKLYIIQGLFMMQLPKWGIALLVLLVGIFLGFFYHIMRMISDRRTKSSMPKFVGPERQMVYVSLIVCILSSIFLTDFANELICKAGKILGGS